MADHLAPRVSQASVNSASPLHDDLWEVSAEELGNLHDPKSLKLLDQMGGHENIGQVLKSDLKKGLRSGDHESLASRVKKFGFNRLPLAVLKGFFLLCYEAMKDKVLILLSIAAVVSLALGLYETFGGSTQYDDEGNPLPKVDWVEGVAIIVAVVIVVVVGAANDYQKERQFAKLNQKKENRGVIVVRDGAQVIISIYDLTVGDLIAIQTGDVVPSDAIMISGEVECDESALTGESEPIMKYSAEEALIEYRSHLPTEEDIGSTKINFKDPFLISGSKILSGRGTAIVTAVGVNSIHGKTMLSLQVEAESSPLQQRLDGLAEGISKYGSLLALVLFIVLFIRYCINIAPGHRDHNIESTEKGKKFVDILITAITIVVVAVPEGLPLAVTLALAFATIRMSQNGNLVRVLKSCETMGGATAICSDKTGTLTENKMKVVRGFVGSPEIEFDETSGYGTKPLEVFGDLNDDLKDLFLENVVVNSTAFDNADYDEESYKRAREKPVKRGFLATMLSKGNRQKEIIANEIVSEKYLGNKTESALLILAGDYLDAFADVNLETQREQASGNIVQVIPFESSRKWSGIVLKIDGGYRLLAKGAAEILIKNCGNQLDHEGKVVPMDRLKRDAALNKIDEYANDALRAIVLAHDDYLNAKAWPPAELQSAENPNEADPGLLIDLKLQYYDTHQSLTLDAMVAIQDPLKQGVPDSVLKCKQAGVTVRMVTGDNLNTAKAISKACHILTPDDLSNEYAFMEGPKFRLLSPEKRKEIAPQLRVLARSSPEDKRILVDTLRKSGEVVAVTGDGTNDAPALKLADVGFSMGISGTEVAREASDIILMTDNFNDIVEAIKWGRAVSTSIKKFIQFQITVNITACVLTFVSAVASSEGHSVLTAVQLLWVNLIMDTLAALALATDKPDDSLLKRKPAGRTTPLISVSMWKMILGQSITQLIITFLLHFGGKKLFYGNREISNHQSQMLNALTFNTFVWLQFWKLFVTRKLDECDGVKKIRDRINAENLNFFLHLFRNWYFIAIALIIGGCQVLIMFVGGAAFSIARQTPGMWATAILCGMISLPVGAVIRICPDYLVVKIFPTRAFNVLIYYLGFNFLKKKKKTEDIEKGSIEDNN